MSRYALYYAPRSEETLARFGRDWLGRDPEEGRPCSAPELPGISPERLRDITAEARHYGFHGTLKPPFRLAEGRSEAELLAAVADFAAICRPVAIPGLELASLDGFLALLPRGAIAALATLAADCVTRFDPFRAPPDSAELDRRRRAGLSPRQEQLLVRWGYPYVLEEFRFHLTLTARIDAAERDVVRQALIPLCATFADAPLPVRDLTVFHQDAASRPFRLRARFAFAGA
jgi:putative phosphonate metabolism protein